MNQGEVWLVDFAPKVGEEIDKVRPAIVVNNDKIGNLRLKVVVPITGASLDFEWIAKLTPTKSNGLTKPSSADCFQIKSLSQERFVRRLGKLSEKELLNVKIGLAKVLDLF